MKNIFIQKTKGMTLVELIVAIGLMTIIMAGMSLFFSSVWHTNLFVMRSGQNSLSSSRGVSEIVEFVRNARTGADGSFPIVEATETEFTFFADVDADDVAERVHIFYDDTANPKTVKYGFAESDSNIPPEYPEDDDSITTLSNYVVNTESQPIFTYFDSSNTELSATPTLSTVRMVKVSIYTNINPVADPNNVEVSSFVSLRNLWEE